MRRRGVIGGAAAAAIALPAAARGQAAPPVIGFLHSTGASGQDDTVPSVRAGFADAGLVEGRDAAIEFRWADNRADRLRTMAAELAGRPVAAIVANSPAALAAKAATATIPIVFVSGEDPVRLGLVASLTRPAGNVTGVSFLDTELGAKRLAMLHELVPRLATIAVLVDPTFPGTPTELRLVEEAARSLGRRIQVVQASSDAEIDAAFATAVGAGAQGVYVGTGPSYASRRERFAALAARHRLPAIYALRRYAESGGLLSYGPSLTDAWRRGGVYVARILRGAKPADLPVELPTKYELVVNQRAAKAINFEVPPALLAAADEVIE